MKKLIALSLVCVLLLTLAACGGNAGGTENVGGDQGDTVTTTTKDDSQTVTTELTLEAVKSAPVTDAALFDVEDVEGGVAITGFNGTNEIVVIPETINGKTVVAIGEKAFANNQTIRGLKISNSVSVIGDSAYMNCFSLEVVTFGSSVKTVEYHAFNACEKLKTVELNEGLETMIQCFIFTDIDRIEIPASVKDMQSPFVVPFTEPHIILVGESGGYVEQYVEENGSEYRLSFEAK